MVFCLSVRKGGKGRLSLVCSLRGQGGEPGEDEDSILAVITGMAVPVVDSECLSNMIKIMGWISVRNGVSSSLCYFLCKPAFNCPHGCEERKKEERGCCLHPFARKELTEHTTKQVGQDC